MKSTLLSLPLLLLPMVTLAQINTTYFDVGAGGINAIIDQILIPLVIALAVLVFLWGVFKAFILGGTDEGKRAEGRQLMLWGIIAFVVMVGIWGVIELVQVLFGVDSNPGTLQAPGVPTTP